MITIKPIPPAELEAARISAIKQAAGDVITVRYPRGDKQMNMNMKASLLLNAARSRTLTAP